MDGWSALGAAAAIAQFIDFGSRLVSTTIETHRSADGLTEQLKDHTVVTERLQTLVDTLTDPIVSTVQSSLKDDLAIQAICSDSRRIGTELLDVVKKIKGQGHRRKLNSFGQALRQVWNEDKVADLSGRLQVLRQELAVHLLVALSCQADKNAREDAERLGSVAETASRVEASFIGNEFVQTLSERAEWRECLLDALQGKDTEKQFPVADADDEDAVQYYRHSINAFTRSLHYPGVMDREFSIAKAHKETLDWIFRDPEPQGFQWTSFVDWLEAHTSPNVYWITGKAGSGKSTLIKYIHNHTVTRESLRRWSPDLPVITPVFYFWNSGTAMQMSLLGLLQTLLRGILHERPECIPLASRSRWEAHRLFATPISSWTRAEALEALMAVVRHCTNFSRLCIFIDGLDEFEGDPEELIGLVNGLLLTNVKVCVASRPWPVFRDHFGQGPSLILEHLNLPDIKRFVTNCFDRSAGFSELKARDPEQANALTHEVTLRSSGVFLWVSLVVRSLLEGLARGDRLSDMHRTLEDLPTELEKLFEVMINQLDVTARKRAAEMFRIVGAADSPLPLILFADADEENPRYALEFEPKVLSPDQRLSGCLGMERRLNSYCKGLLEVTILEFSRNYPKGQPIKVNDAQKILSSLNDPGDVGDYVNEVCSSEVKYLHRTVKDYLTLPAVKAQLKSWTAPDFHPDCSLSSAFLVSLKMTDPLSVSREVFWLPIDRFLSYAARFEASSDTTLSSLLDELERVVCDLLLKRNSNNKTVSRAMAQVSKQEILPYWTGTLAPTGVMKERSFLGLILQSRLFSYAQIVLENRPLDRSEISGYPLLLSAFMDYYPLETHMNNTHPPASLVKTLLKKGADPNAASFENISPWQFVLRKSAAELPGAGAALASYWAKIFILFMDYRADPRHQISPGTLRAIERHSPDKAKNLRAKIRKRRAVGIIRRLTLLDSNA